MGKHLLLSFLFTFFVTALCQSSLPDPGKKTGNAKWVRINVNMVVDTPADVLGLVDEAKAAGANAVHFVDSKLYTWWFRSAGATWLSRVKEVRAGIQARGMQFVLGGPGVGYCAGPTANDQNLATGYPMKDVPLKVENGVLKAVQTASIPNGGFESANGNVPASWGFQDSPGVTTFVDSTVSKSGQKSMRFDMKPGAKARLFGEFPIKPFQQYTLSLWMKVQGLTADKVLVLIRDFATKRSLTQQFPSEARAGGGRTYFDSANNKNMDWTEMKFSFNSQDSTTLQVTLATFGGEQGSIWWDDVQLVATPLMNLLRRNSLPFTLKTSDGRVLKEGTDVSPAKDPLLGQSRYGGNYDNYHNVPDIKVLSGSGLSNGATVLLSGYHTIITARGQIGCTWSDQKMFQTVRKTYVENDKAFSPDAYFPDHNEIRTGGWEPAEVAKGSSGKALAAYIRREVNMIRKVTGNKNIYLWSDMFDPQHNAEKDKFYYQVRDSLFGSWNGVDKTKVVIMNWKGESRLKSSSAVESYKFFDSKSYTQIAAGFYDMDVTENFNLWKSAIAGRPNAGNMYTTWTRDYSKLESYGNLWW